VAELKACNNCMSRALGFWYGLADGAWRRDGFHGRDLKALPGAESSWSVVVWSGLDANGSFNQYATRVEAQLAAEVRALEARVADLEADPTPNPERP